MESLVRALDATANENLSGPVLIFLLVLVLPLLCFLLLIFLSPFPVPAGRGTRAERPILDYMLDCWKDKPVVDRPSEAVSDERLSSLEDLMRPLLVTDGFIKMKRVRIGCRCAAAVSARPNQLGSVSTTINDQDPACPALVDYAKRPVVDIYV